MKVIKTDEAGYQSAILGFSFSYNTSLARAEELLPKYAWGEKSGENKFLRVMWLWFDVDFPRLIWPEADQYKVATTTLSESTVHTLGKRTVTQDDFEIKLDDDMLDIVNRKILQYQRKEIGLLELKGHLPEGFLQRRMWNFNYANLQNLIAQRVGHRVTLWDQFIKDVLSQIDHPEFAIKDWTK